MMTDDGAPRDFDKRPYSSDETRVAEWLATWTGAGGGDDPIGAMLAILGLVVGQRKRYRDALRDIVANAALNQAVEIAEEALRDG